MVPLPSLSTAPSVNNFLIWHFCIHIYCISNLNAESNCTCSCMLNCTHLAAPELKATSNVVPKFICSCHNSNSCGYLFHYYVHPAIYRLTFTRECCLWEIFFPSVWVLLGLKRPEAIAYIPCS